VLRILKQCALEERKRARLLERDHDRYVFLEKGEARFASLEFFGQVAVECDLTKPKKDKWAGSGKSIPSVG
jgi:hypothetical protein